MKWSLMALAAALSYAALGCSTSCPDPRFAGPVKATWSPRAVVVTWPATPGDRLPDPYYASAELQMAGDAGAAVKGVRSTGPRELTIEIDDVEAQARSSPRLDIDLGFPDQRSFIACTHPGRDDSFSVRLALNFDPAAHTVSASFGELHEHRGACSASGRTGAEGGDRWILALVVAGAITSRRAARRRRGALRAR